MIELAECPCIILYSTPFFNTLFLFFLYTFFTLIPLYSQSVYFIYPLGFPSGAMD